MCGRGHQSKPIEWDETSDEALSSFPLMMMRKRWKLLFFQFWTRTPRTVRVRPMLTWSMSSLIIFVRNLDFVMADGPSPTFGFWTCSRPWNPDWNTVTFRYWICSWISPLPWFEPRSMMWKYFLLQARSRMSPLF